jgi:hypothetical protein
MADSELDRLYKMTGGPAFGHGNPNDGGAPGMSIRDWFAGQALDQAVQDYDRMGRTPYMEGGRLLPYEAKAVGTREEIIARQAYRYADAMLKARCGGGDHDQ